jgi:HEAT repeat protein
MSFFPPPKQITIEAGIRDLASGKPASRVHAAHALGDLTDPDEQARAVPALIAALGDDLAEVRAEAAASLGELADRRAVEPLARRLGDGDPRVRQNAAIALGTLRDPGGSKPLVEALRDGPPDLRFQAATSLAEIDPAAAYQPLVAALGDTDPQVVSAIALALGALGDGRAVAHLAALLDHADPGVRFDAAYGLAELRDGRGREILGKALDDAQRGWDAACALEWLGTPADAALLLAVIGKKKADPNAVIRAAGAALRIGGQPGNEIDGEGARKLLLAHLTHRKTPLRGLAVQELATAGGAWAVEPLETLRRSRKGREIADEIADALRQIKERAA